MKNIIMQSGIRGKIKYELGVVLGSRNKERIVTLAGIFRHPLYRIKMLRHVYVLDKRNREIMSVQDAEIWRNNFYKLVLSTYEKRYEQIIDDFYEARLTCLKSIDVQQGEPIVVGAVRDDLIKIKEIINHYRRLGVKYFAFVDNGSTDGTREFLMEQDDVILFVTDMKYNGRRKTMWINHMITKLGQNRWYLMIDSDECFVYPHYEEVSLKEYTNRLLDKDITEEKSLLIEVYPKGDLFDDLRSDANFMNEYCWFDGDSDYYIYDMEKKTVSGGLHARVFNTEDANKTKVVLFYAEKGRFPTGSHDIYPIYENTDARFGSILLHYKFLRCDLTKINRIIEEKTYAHGSAIYQQYKTVFEHMKLAVLFYEGSVQWKGTESFKEFTIIEDLMEE